MNAPEPDSEFADLPERPRASIPGSYQPRSGSRDAWSYAPLVLGILTGLVAVGAVVVEHRFWMLKLAGRTSTGTVVQREEHIIGWGHTRRRAFPITETRFGVDFQDEHGTLNRAEIRVPWSSSAFRTGESVNLMYSSDSPGEARPADWGFYIEHDSMWLTAAIGGGVSILVSILCFRRERRLRRAAA